MQQLTEDLINVITASVIEIHETQREKEFQKEKDNRLRNVKILMQNYHSFKIHAERIKEKVASDISEYDSIDVIIENKQDILKSIKQSKQRTLAMIKHIDDVLDVYKIICEKSEIPEVQRRYQTVHAKYILRENIETIATLQNLSPRTVYVDIQKALETLTVLMFGVDSLKVT